MQVTIDDVLVAVSVALDAAFPDIPIALEEIKQELEPPYFFIRLLEPSHTHLLDRRYRRDHPMAIRYFAPGRSNRDMYAMAEQLTTVLRWITVGSGKEAGRNMSFQIIDGVLHFFISYRFHVLEERPTGVKMQALNQEVTLKHEGKI